MSVLRWTLCIMVVATSGLFAAASANAQGFEAAPFRPASSARLGYITLEDASAALPRSFEFHGGTVYERQLVTLSQSGASQPLVSHRFALQLGGSIAPVERLRVHVSMPFYLLQRGDDELLAPSDADLDRGGVGDLRLFAKVRLFGHAEGERGFGLGASLAVALPTGRQNQLQGDGVRVTPSVHVDYVHRWFSVAASLGYLVRPERVLVGLHIDDALELGVAGRVPLGSTPLDALVEFTASIGVQGPSVGEARTRPMMVHAALRGMHGPIVWKLGGGAGLTTGYAAPELRVFGQVAYAPVPDVVRDTDGYGFDDPVDGCPLEAEDVDGHDDQDGCPDLDDDQDGIRDADDACPAEPEDADGFDDRDGCPDADNDSDGIPDPEDACPLEGEDLDGFDDQDGCPDPDDDQDGIPDAQDACPREAGPADADPAGCPVAEPLPEPPPAIQIDDVVRFRTRSAELDRSARSALTRVVGTLREHPTVRVRVVGHADQRGDDALNARLSQARAEAVRDFLVAHGVDAARLEAVGHGTHELLDASTTPEAYQRNRRVQFIILEGRE